MHLVNEVTDAVTVKSKDVGQVMIGQIEQTGSNQLGEPTAIKVIFSTQNPIPIGSML